MRIRLIAEWLILLAFACIIAVTSLVTAISSKVDFALLDYSTALIDRPANQDITIVQIDDASLQQVGSWPWPRNTHAALVDRLSAMGARLIVLDILFFEETSTDSDAALGRAISDANNVLLPISFQTAFDGSGRNETIEPIAEIASGAIATGHVALEFSDDGIVRHISLAHDLDGREAVPHLMIAAHQRAYGELPDQVLGQQQGAPWPLLDFQQAGHFKTVSAASILDGSVPQNLIEDQIVLVGATAQGMGDAYAVPAHAGGIMSGVEIQANLLESLQSDQFISKSSFWTTVFVTLLTISLLFLGFWQLPPQFSLILTASLAGALLLMSVGGVAAVGWWFPPGSALLAIVISYPLWGWRRLASVSNFLDRQAVSLAGVSTRISDRGGGGFDFVARQVDRMRGLLSEFSERFSFIRNIIEAAPDAIIVLDKNRLVTMKNQKAVTLFGPEEGDQYLPEMLSSVGAVLDGAKGDLNLPDGRSYLVAEASFASEEQHDDSHTGQIMVLRNVTELKRKEAERQEMLEFLSHDMRTPQVSIIGLSGRDSVIADNDKRFERIQQQAKRTLKLADDFVQLARLSETPVEKEDTDLCALINEAADRCYTTAKKNAVTIHQELPDDPVFIYADPSLLARVFDNLLSNALKFSPAGSTISICIAELLENGEYVSVSVADQGPGLPIERQDNPFARFGHHDDSAGPSVGLGLAFVEMAVNANDGLISVDTATGEGTKFTIQLPVAPEI
ncbi:CHASE2 domain-containing protein [Altererythrobacter sp. RZ02]|uniref:histidine kinase n=1 Tax=Pontixanthobacter rizhaonensis TaxID=2730337 RepID=A0A848QL11_9SPHN|nr:CHASE2 domain-containing protein [Pontixanthobacter rizhaonensis]